MDKVTSKNFAKTRVNRPLSNYAPVPANSNLKQEPMPEVEASCEKIKQKCENLARSPNFKLLFTGTEA